MFHEYFTFLFPDYRFLFYVTLLTMATNGVIIQPILAAPEHAPNPIPRMLVGYTSGVYT